MPFLPLRAPDAAGARTAATHVPVAASTAVRELLARPAPGTVVAVFPPAVYVGLDGGEVLAVVTADGVRLPNALAVAAGSRSSPFAGHLPGAPAEVRDGVLRVGDVRYVPVREWTPRTAVSGAPLPGAVDELAARLPAGTHSGPVGDRLRRAVGALQEALGDGDVARARSAGEGLLGLGPGLTPAGDDVLAGALVTCTQLGGARSPVTRAARAVGQHVVERQHRTPALSAALLRHAADGRAAEPVVGVLDALTGRRPLGPALRDLLAVGHTSGADTAVGVLAAARALSDEGATG